MDNAIMKGYKAECKRWKERAQLAWSVSLGLLISSLIMLIIIYDQAKLDGVAEPPETTELSEVTDTVKVEYVEVETPKEPPQITENMYIPVVESSPVKAELIGDFLITYYCSCEICCDEHAKNRPVVNNQEVVLTASGSYAEEGITVAVDPNKIPYGTLLYIEGVGYRIAQDCGGAIQGNKIDVYMDTHAEAYQQGKHESKVYIITGGIENEQE